MHEHRIQTRWTDFDALGHVTYAAYPVFCDEAREAFLVDRVGGFEEWPTVVVHFEIDYRKEIRHPADEVRVRTRVERVGRTSVTFEQEVVGEDGPAAAARTVLVSWDREARGAVAIGDDARAALER
jgi:acyl-CoA thioester hydrolase